MTFRARDKLLPTMHKQENLLCGLAKRRENANGKYDAHDPGVISRDSEPKGAAKRQEHESD